MARRSACLLTLTTFLILPAVAGAKPPAHAPAHGYRAKQAPAAPAPAPEPAQSGVRVAFDSELGIHVAIGLPGVVFHEGRYYREHEGRWQVSLSGDGGWSFMASSGVPSLVVESRKARPAPAKVKPGKKRK